MLILTYRYNIHKKSVLKYLEDIRTFIKIKNIDYENIPTYIMYL